MQLTRKRPSVPRIGGLPATRRSALALSLVCALGAAGIILVAVGNYRKNVQKTVVKQDTVLESTGLISKGTSAQAAAAQKLFRPFPVTQGQLRAGAITDAAAIQGRFAAADILPGQQLTAGEWTTGSGIAYQLAPDQRAVSVALDGAHGNLGVIQPGDRVDIYGSVNLSSDGNLTTIAGAPNPHSSSAGGSIPLVRLLAADALVLRVPTTSGSAGALGGGGGGSSTSSDVVLAVSQTQTPDLEWTADFGKVWLALRPANATPPDQSATDIGTLAFGVRVIVLPHPDGSVAFIGVGGLVPGGQVPALTAQRWATNTGAHR